jgi:hypothetical protein
MKQVPWPNKQGRSESDNKPQTNSTYHQVNDDQPENPIKKNQAKRSCKKKTVGETTSMGVRFRRIKFFFGMREMIHALACLLKKGVLKPLFFFPWSGGTRRMYNGRLGLRPSQ